MGTEPASVSPECELVWQFFGQRRDGFFVDVGANEPHKNSQSWFLEERGWRGILVEPQAQFCERLRQFRPASRVFQVACGAPDSPPEMTFFVAERPGHSGLVKNRVEAETKYVRTETVKIMTLDAILQQAGDPKLDFVSIDVEGTQLDVLKGFNLHRHRPVLLLVEDHLHELSAHTFIRKQGYRLIKRTGLNNWYVPNETPLRAAFIQRLRLFRKIWLNTPFRKFRVFRERRRARARYAKRQA